MTHFTELGKELEKNKISCKIVAEYPYLSIRGYFHKYQKKREFKELIRNFNPDFVITDSPSDLGLEAIKAKKPLLILLRGDYWLERNIYFRNMKKFSFRFLNFWLTNKIAKQCFENSSMILPVCKYLQEVIQKEYPKKLVKILHIGIDPSQWNKTKGIVLKHPCVGIVQKVNIWEKTKEMLILVEILKKFPNVHFYWAGDGKYSDKIISTLDDYQNFHWLGNLDYPEQIKNFLSEIDIFALFSGLDMTPLSILEASLMGKPVIATRVCGIPETIKDKESGFLAELGNPYQWISFLQILLENPDKAKNMGENGHNFILEEFNLKTMATNLVSYCNQISK